MKLWMTFCAVAVGLQLVVPAAWAGDTRAGAITISDAWVRPSMGGAPNSAAYMTLHNAGDTADALLSASTPAAKRTELHRSVTQGGVARMEPVDEVAVPVGGSVELRPGGLHIMLLDLQRRITVGEKVELTLTFRQAGAVTVHADAAMRVPEGHEPRTYGPKGGHAH